MRAFANSLIGRIVFWVLVAGVILTLILTLRSQANGPTPVSERQVTIRATETPAAAAATSTPTSTLTPVPFTTPTIQTTRMTLTPPPAIPPTRTPVVPHVRGAFVLHGQSDVLGAEPLAIASDKQQLYVLLSGELVVLAPGTQPAVLGRVRVGGGELAVPAHLYAADGIVYIAASQAGLLIVDARDPAVPQLVSATPLLGAAWQVVGLRDSTLFIVVIAPCVTQCEERDTRSTLYAVDVSDPAAPTILSEWSVPGSLSTATLEEGFVYAATEERVSVLDVTDPATLNELGEFSLPAPGEQTIERIHTVEVHAERLHIVANGMLTVLDVSEPLQPATLVDRVGGWVELPGPYAGALIREPFAVLYDERLGGLALFDISRLEDPQPLGAYGPASGLSSTGYRQPAVLLDGTLYAIDGNGAVNVLAVEAPGW